MSDSVASGVVAATPAADTADPPPTAFALATLPPPVVSPAKTPTDIDPAPLNPLDANSHPYLLETPLLLAMGSDEAPTKALSARRAGRT